MECLQFNSKMEIIWAFQTKVKSGSFLLVLPPRRKQPKKQPQTFRILQNCFMTFRYNRTELFWRYYMNRTWFYWNCYCTSAIDVSPSAAKPALLRTTDTSKTASSNKTGIMIMSLRRFYHFVGSFVGRLSVSRVRSATICDCRYVGPRGRFATYCRNFWYWT